MKARFVWKWGLGVCLSVLPFAGGCLQGASSSAVTNDVHVATAATNVSVETEDAEALKAAATNAPDVDISQADVKPILQEKAVPEEVEGAGAAGELLKLANSGVEEGVILSYITNSPSLFDLSADQIIYLKDLGVSGTVVSAALHHDQALKAQGLVDTAPQPAPAETYAEAPTGTTSNWIGSVQQPAPEQVAPQAVGPEQAPPGGTAVAAPAPQVQVNYSTFYSSLAPYGTWYEVDGYGPVWRPTIVVNDPGWRPYFDSGRWIYTDHGWYWSSDYSWGWAPFHYGRWFHHHRIGWCWSPDYVWGPAWVSWRYNNDYCGWAPLPPAACYRPGFGFTYYGSRVGFSFGFGLSHHHYSFVHWNRFHHKHHHHHAVSRDHSRDVFNKTKVVTKIVGNNNTVINEGISAQRVSAATRTDVRKVALRESRVERPQTGRAERLDPARKTLTVFKPETPKNQPQVGGIPMERTRTERVARAERNTRTAAATLAPSGGDRQGRTANAEARSDRNRESGMTRTTLVQPDQNRSRDNAVPRVAPANNAAEGTRKDRPADATRPARTENRTAQSGVNVPRQGTSPATPAARVDRSGDNRQSAERHDGNRQRLNAGTGERNDAARQAQTPGQQQPRRTEPLILRGSQGNNAGSQSDRPRTANQVERNEGSRQMAVPRNEVGRQVQAATPATPAPGVQQQQRPMVWQQPSTGSGQGAARREAARDGGENRPAIQVPRAAPAQPSSSASTRVWQAPSRVERQASVQPPAPAFSTPQQSTASDSSRFRQSQSVPRTFSAPPQAAQVPRQSGFSAQPRQQLGSSPGGGGGSGFSAAPSAPQRSFSAPSAPRASMNIQSGGGGGGRGPVGGGGGGRGGGGGGGGGGRGRDR